MFEGAQAAHLGGDRAAVRVGCPLCKRAVKWDAIFRAASAAHGAAAQAAAAAQDNDPDDPGLAQASEVCTMQIDRLLNS